MASSPSHRRVRQFFETVGNMSVSFIPGTILLITMLAFRQGVCRTPRPQQCHACLVLVAVWHSFVPCPKDGDHITMTELILTVYVNPTGWNWNESDFDGVRRRPYPTAGIGLFSKSSLSSQAVNPFPTAVGARKKDHWQFDSYFKRKRRTRRRNNSQKDIMPMQYKNKNTRWYPVINNCYRDRSISYYMYVYVR